tara:strand:+ start:1775 stop:1933 length:159 start_codon:yes stop_codon:yes gene_type:complete
MRIKEVDKNIDSFYNNLNETTAGGIAAVVMPFKQPEPIKRKPSKKKQKKKNA